MKGSYDRGEGKGKGRAEEGNRVNPLVTQGESSGSARSWKQPCLRLLSADDGREEPKANEESETTCETLLRRRVRRLRPSVAD